MFPLSFTQEQLREVLEDFVRFVAERAPGITASSMTNWSDHYLACGALEDHIDRQRQRAVWSSTGDEEP